MQVSVETISGLERRLVITVPAAQIDEKVTERLKQTAKQVRIDGFRPGKVPLRIVKQRYGASARHEVIGDVIQSSFFEAVHQESLNPAGMPSVEPGESSEGEDLKFTATFEVYPEIAIGDLAQVSVEKPVAEIQEADIDKMVETLREQNKQYVEVERAAADGDQVVIDFKGMIDGEAFDNGSAEGHTLVLGSGAMIPGFEDGILGMSAGETKIIDVKFPENYQAEELKGKDTQFEIKVYKVSQPELAELNDEFFAQFGASEAGLDGFRAEVRKNMERELKQAIRAKVKNQVMDGLLSIHEFDVPKSLVDGEIDGLRRQAIRQIAGGRNQFDPSALPAHIFEDQAKKRVSLGLLIGELIKQKELKVDEERVKAFVEDIASAYQQPEQVVEWYFKNEQQLNQVKSVVLEDQVVDTVLDAAQVSEKACSYEEAMQPAQQADSEENSEEAAS